MINRRERVPEFSGLPEQEKSNKRMTIELAPEQEKGLDDFLEQQDKKFEKLKPSKLKKTLRNIAVGAGLIAAVWGMSGCFGPERDAEEQKKPEQAGIVQEVGTQEKAAAEAIKAEVQEAQSFLEEQRTRAIDLLGDLAIIPNQPMAETERQNQLLQKRVARDSIFVLAAQIKAGEENIEGVRISRTDVNHALEIINGYIPDFADEVYGNNDGHCETEELEKFHQETKNLAGFQSLAEMTIEYSQPEENK